MNPGSLAAEPDSRLKTSCNRRKLEAIETTQGFKWGRGLVSDLLLKAHPGSMGSGVLGSKRGNGTQRGGHCRGPDET